MSLHAGLQSPALQPAWCTSRSLKTLSYTNVGTPLPGVSPGSAPSLLCDSDRSVHFSEPPRGISPNAYVTAVSSGRVKTRQVLGQRPYAAITSAHQYTRMSVKVFGP